jgi:hypothetical protein
MGTLVPLSEIEIEGDLQLISTEEGGWTQVTVRAITDQRIDVETCATTWMRKFCERNGHRMKLKLHSSFELRRHLQ